MRCVAVSFTLFTVAVILGRSAGVASLDELKPARVLDLRGATNHVQGVDSDGERIWVTSVDAPNRKGYLHEFSMKTGASLRIVEMHDGDRFHPGGIAADANSLWVPVAEYRAQSTSVIRRVNKKTLKAEFQFTVADHIGCIAVTAEFLIGGNWDSRDFYIWDHSGTLIRKVASSTGNAYQDMKFDSNYLVASGMLSDKTGAIDWLELPSLRLVRRMTAGKTDRGTVFTQEGMSIHGRQLLLLPEDSPSRLFTFRLPR